MRSLGNYRTPLIMSNQPKQTTWVRKGFFVIFVCSLLGAYVPLETAMKLKAARDHRNLVEGLQIKLSNAILSQSEEFSRERWVRTRGTGFLRWARQRLTTRDFSPTTAEQLGRDLAKFFPAGAVFSFDQSGKLVFQSGKESRRSRELFWDGILAFQRDPGGDPYDKRFQMADRFCKGIYGTLTSLSDLANPNGLPQPFLDKGKSMISWVVPQEIILFPTPGAPFQGKGGLWLLVDPTRLPVDQIAQKTLRSFPEVADTVLILRNFKGKARLEKKFGRTGLLASTAEKFLAGETECEDRYGLWVGRYIPGESGRFLIAGVRQKNLDGWLDRWDRTLKLFYGMFLLFATLFGFRFFWQGHSLPLNLQRQVFILFAIVAVFPLAAVVFQGFVLAGDNAQRSRNAWEQRMNDTLDKIDRQGISFREEQGKIIKDIEKEFTRSLPLTEGATAELQRLCGRWDKLEIMVIDELGTRLNFCRNMENIQRRGEYPAYMARYLARLLEVEDRVPPPVLSNAFTLLTGHVLENLLNLLFRREDTFDRLRSGDTTILQIKAILVKPGTQPPRTLGLISWLFDEAEFMKPFVVRTLREASGPANRFHPIRIGFAAPGGKLFPPELETSAKLRIMVERVEKFQSSETGVVSFLNGKSYLTTVLYPVRMGGYLLIGMIETREESGQILDFQDFQRILGFGEILPLEKDRIFALRVLFVSILLSLLLMFPMAIVLSRWIVGRIRTLHGMVEEIGRNQFGVRAAIPADDELGELALAFNEMAGGLQERERMSRFVSDQVLEEVKKDDAESLALGGEKREVAVLFTHIHHFNDLLERHPPEALIERLNEYFTVMNAPIKAENGSIDKLIGDAIMAVFFHQPGLDHPALRAVNAARAMFKKEAGQAWGLDPLGGIHFRTDFGIHFGPAISGKVGSTHGMIDFTVIGDTVNTAARIQGAAARQEQASILISGEVRKFLPAAVSLQELDQITLKGKSQSLTLYKIITCP